METFDHWLSCEHVGHSIKGQVKDSNFITLQEGVLVKSLIKNINELVSGVIFKTVLREHFLAHLGPTARAAAVAAANKAAAANQWLLSFSNDVRKLRTVCYHLGLHGNHETEGHLLLELDFIFSQWFSMEDWS